MGTLPLPPTSKPPPAPSPPSPTNMFTCSEFISTSPFTPSPPKHLSSFCFHSTFHTSTTHKHTTNQQLATTPSTNSTPHQNLRILQWNAGGLSPSRRAELIAFLSNNQYDLILLQETHLSANKKFQIPGYFTLSTDRTFGRQGPVSSGTHHTGGGVLTLIHSDLAFSPVSVSSLSSQDPYSDYIYVKVLFSNHSLLQFLNLYSPPIRSTPSDSRPRTFFSPDILPNSPDTFILGDFNAHHPIWDRLIPPNPPENDLFRWITSAGLEILNDPLSHAPPSFHWEPFVPRYFVI